MYIYLSIKPLETIWIGAILNKALLKFGYIHEHAPIFGGATNMSRK